MASTRVVMFQQRICVELVGEFSLSCCTSMAHAGNTKIWVKITSSYAKKCSITGFSSVRGGMGGGKKRKNIYALSGHERKEQRSDVDKAFK